MCDGNSDESCIRRGSRSPVGRVTFVAKDVEILPHTATTATDLGISLLAVEQCDTVGCHIESPHRDKSPVNNFVIFRRFEQIITTFTVVCSSLILS